MRKMIKLERIGDGRHGAKLPYCKRVVKMSDYGFATELLKPNRDYSKANSVGSRGVYDYYILSPGLYEIFERISWSRSRHYFLYLHENGDKTEMTFEEAIECLSNGLISMS